MMRAQDGADINKCTARGTHVEERYDDDGADEEWPTTSCMTDTTTGDWCDFSTYIAEVWNKKWTVEDPIEAGELECMAYVCDVIGTDSLQDPETCSEIIQSSSVAFLAKGGKAKGKGKGKGKYQVRPSNISIEDRRKALAELKSKTPCKDCGRKGHWRGDKECTMQKNQPYERRANVAIKNNVRFCDAYSTSRCPSGNEASQSASRCPSVEETSPFFFVGDDHWRHHTCGQGDWRYRRN